MIRAFTVSLELEDGENLLDVAEELFNGLEGEGFDVVSVNPVDSPNSLESLPAFTGGLTPTPGAPAAGF